MASISQTHPALGGPSFLLLTIIPADKKWQNINHSIIHIGVAFCRKITTYITWVLDLPQMVDSILHTLKLKECPN